MEMNDAQIKEEFAHQIYLCGSIGREAMHLMIDVAFSTDHQWKCSDCGKLYRFGGHGHTCKSFEPPLEINNG